MKKGIRFSLIEKDDGYDYIGITIFDETDKFSSSDLPPKISTIKM